jgi:hypothetical protein
MRLKPIIERLDVALPSFDVTSHHGGGSWGLSIGTTVTSVHGVRSLRCSASRSAVSDSQAEIVMNVPQLLVASPLQVFEWVTGKTDSEVVRLVLNASLFIPPVAVRRKPVMFPNCVRTSKAHHPGKAKKAMSEWKGGPVKVCDNTTARIAFGRYIGRSMNGENREVAVGWEVAHVWATVHDPEYFTAGWNRYLVPGFLRVLTEEQAQMPLFAKCLQFVAWNLFFKDPVALPTTPPPQPTADFPEWLLTFEPRFAITKTGAIPPGEEVGRQAEGCAQVEDSTTSLGDTSAASIVSHPGWTGRRRSSWRR